MKPLLAILWDIGLLYGISYLMYAAPQICHFDGCHFEWWVFPTIITSIIGAYILGVLPWAIIQSLEEIERDNESTKEKIARARRNEIMSN